MVKFDYNESERVLTCNLSGRMEVLAAQEFEAALQEHLAGEALPQRCVFDMAQVDYVASAFLRICLGTAKKMPPGCFAVMNTAPQVKKVFMVAGLCQAFEVG